MIYIICHSGYFNLGDELIPRAWIDYLTNKFPDEVIYIDTCDPGKSAVIFRNYKNIVFVDTLWEISRECMDKSIDYIVKAKFFESISVSRKNGLKLLSEATKVHMLGGGYLNDELWFNYSIPIALSILKKKMNFKLYATGLGMEPANPGYYEIVASHMQNFDLLDTRDRQSYDRLQSYGLRENLLFSCDDLFLSIPKRSDVGCSKEPRLIIAPQKGGDPQAVASFCIKLAREYPIKDNEIYLLSLNAESDHEISNIVANCLGERCRKFEFNELWENGFPINSGDIVFTTRFHAHLIASSLGARGYAASVSIPYYDIKHGSLSSLNSGFDVIGMHDFHFQVSDKILDTTEPTLANRVNELRAIKLDIASKIYDNINLSEVPLGAAQQLIHDGEPMSLPC